jgi:hypothetical protein
METIKDPRVIRRIRQKFDLLASSMDPRLRRQWAAIEAMDLGWGGVKTVSLATGLDRHTILAGTRELERRGTRPKEKSPRSIRPAVAGRKRLTQTDPELQGALEALIHPLEREEQDPPLRWTCQSTSKLAQELRRRNHPVSDRTVAALLRAAGYSLLDRRRCNEGSSQADRNAQFAFINAQCSAFHSQGQPVVWLDTTKQDVDVDQSAARFAASSIGRWWEEMGRPPLPNASKLLIAADVGGSHSGRQRLWKAGLQDLANELGLPLEICHFPPGATKWRKIEHRLSNFMTQDWRGRALVSCQVTVNLIAPSAAANNLKRAEANVTPSRFHAEWNYTIGPL